MKKVTIDLNIILDFLNKRKNHLEAAQIIQLCVDSKIEGFVCAHEITTLSYFLEKRSKEHSEVSDIIRKFLKIFNVISIDKEILEKALDSKIIDFEEAVVEQSSSKYNIDFIITRNLTDFIKSKIEAISPVEFLEKFNKEL